MRFVKHLLIPAGMAFVLMACKKVNDLGIRPIGEAAVEVKIQECDIRNVSYSEGLKMTVAYEDRLPVEVQGIQFFNKLRYKQDNLNEIENTSDPSWKIDIEQDGRENITKMTFNGRDGAGRPLTQSYEMFYDSNDQLIKMLLDLPVFWDIVELMFEYNADGNVTKINRVENNTSVTLLENLSFDEKNAPFVYQKQLGQLMSYLLATTVINGDANYTYFLNQNNVTRSIITKGTDKMELSATYEYINEFPSKAQISKNYKDRLSSLTETYAYNCQ
ncbi:hypothetical protein [Jiulongibacter sediminis]|jgi:hypothetical protein|uniref:hypothetical protein n=1 Tax=Jiulongibacter sediminis TaxID=1605367 RepID=UPI0026E959EA|nr:hypothetical protein [Jiulongibacter sediminis]